MKYLLVFVLMLFTIAVSQELPEPTDPPTVSYDKIQWMWGPASTGTWIDITTVSTEVISVAVLPDQADHVYWSVGGNLTFVAAALESTTQDPKIVKIVIALTIPATSPWRWYWFGRMRFAGTITINGVDHPRPYSQASYWVGVVSFTSLSALIHALTS